MVTVIAHPVVIVDISSARVDPMSNRAYLQTKALVNLEKSIAETSKLVPFICIRRENLRVAPWVDRLAIQHADQTLTAVLVEFAELNQSVARLRAEIDAEAFPQWPVMLWRNRSATQRCTQVGNLLVASGSLRRQHHAEADAAESRLVQS